MWWSDGACAVDTTSCSPLLREHVFYRYITQYYQLQVVLLNYDDWVLRPDNFEFSSIYIELTPRDC